MISACRGEGSVAGSMLAARSLPLRCAAALLVQRAPPVSGVGC
jgi:hypothetical protein